MAKIIVVDVEKCMGCHCCEMACAAAHSTTEDVSELVQKGEKPGYRINVEAYGDKAVPVHCQHCQDPACVRACPTGAVYRKGDSEPVLVDNKRCIGCRMCVQACPFGVITVDGQGKGVLKCDLCIERLAQGQEPACVHACPTNALRFVDEHEANRDKRRKTAGQMVRAQQEVRENSEQ